MSNWTDRLTEEDMECFSLRETLLIEMEKCRERLHLPKADFRVCDWGCGRGRSILQLREMGYAAFGAEIDGTRMSNGHALFRQKGYAPESLMLPIHGDGRTAFPNGFFHFVFSEQVFEHVQDLDRVIAEICRVSCLGAGGQHAFPAHRKPIEPHLLMPFVHWLPKNGIRKAWIFLLVLVGFGPDFPTVKGKGILERADIYYRGNITTSFYRHWRVIQGCFEKHGFRLEFISIRNRKLRRIPGWSLFMRVPPLRWVINRLLLSFVGVSLVTIKNAVAQEDGCASTVLAEEGCCGEAQSSL